MLKIKDKYSLVIIGAGPAGLTASIYSSRYKIDNLIIGQALGGLAFEAHKICNFPSEQEIVGMELVNKMQKHAESLGAHLLIDKVIGVERQNKLFKLTTLNNQQFLSQTILLATGTVHRKMNLPNEEKFLGKGISYCATCDAMFYKNKTVAVIGGGNSAHTASLYLAEVADKVYQIYRGEKLRGETVWIDQIIGHKKIKVIFNTQVKAISGKEKLEKIILDKPYHGQKELILDGLFVEIGTLPQKALIKELGLETEANGYIKVKTGQTTNQPAIWAAGDITNASDNFHQVITACSEGAIAAQNIFKYLQEKNKI